MSIVDKIKKNSKKTIVLGGLAAAVLANPSNAKADAQTEEDRIPVKPGCEQQLMEAVKYVQNTGWGQTEIAPYIVFPSFIPVTENGQFDKAAAQELSQKLAPYIKDLAKKDKVTAAEAYESFKKAVGQTDLSYEEFKAFQELADYTKFNKTINNFHLGCMITGLLFGAYSLSMVGHMATTSIMDYGFNKRAWKNLIKGSSFPEIALGLFGPFLLTGGTAIGTINAVKYTPEKAIEQSYKMLYDQYLDTTCEKQIEQMDSQKAQKFEQMKKKWNKNAAEAKKDSKASYDNAVKKVYDNNQKDSR